MRSLPGCVGVHIYSGGFTLGLSKYFDIIGQWEEGPWGADTFTLNFPKVPHPLTMSEWPVAEMKGKAAVVAANPPCACWSTIGARLGRNDPRFQFTLNSFNVAVALDPEIFVIESVCRAWSPNNGGREAYTELAQLAGRAGYQVTIFLTNGILHGSPQSRERFHLIAHRRELSLSEPHVTVFPSSRQVIKDLVSSFSYADEGKPLFLPNHQLLRRPPLKYQVVLDAIREDEGWNACQERLVAAGVTEAGRGRIISGRPPADLPCRTVVDVGAIVHPWQNRFLTVREGARLCGYPDDYVFATTSDRDHGARASDVTQAVLPPMGTYLGRAFTRSLDNVGAQPGELNIVDWRPLARIPLQAGRQEWRRQHRV